MLIGANFPRKGFNINTQGDKKDKVIGFYFCRQKCLGVDLLRIVFCLVAITFASGCAQARRAADLSSPANIWKDAVYIGIQSAANSCNLARNNGRRHITRCCSRSPLNQEELSQDVDVSAQRRHLLPRRSSCNLKQDYSTSTRLMHSKSIKYVSQTANLAGRQQVSSKQGVTQGISAKAGPQRQLLFWENMVCGAISRSVAQVAVHPMDTMKTILQTSGTSNHNGLGGAAAKKTLRNLSRPSSWRLLTRGAGAQFLLSIPHGALSFAVLEYVRRQMNVIVDRHVAVAQAARATDTDEKTEPNITVFARITEPGLDFLSSCISTICCSIISTPQVMITDNIMAGIYPNLSSAVNGIVSKNGVKGLYTGWLPNLGVKIPSYVSLVSILSVNYS